MKLYGLPSGTPEAEIVSALLERYQESANFQPTHLNRAAQRRHFRGVCGEGWKTRGGKAPIFHGWADHGKRWAAECRPYIYLTFPRVRLIIAPTWGTAGGRMPPLHLPHLSTRAIDNRPNMGNGGRQNAAPTFTSPFHACD